MRDRLSRLDAAWIRMEEPTDPMTVTAALTFRAPVDWSALADRLDRALVGRYPRFRRRVIRTVRGLAWEDDPAFALEAHLHRSALPPPGDRAALAAFVGDRVGTPLDLRFAPWEIDLLDGYGGGSAVVVRIHHCIADGLALARILLALADDLLPTPRSATEPIGAPRGPIATARALRKLLASPADPETPLRGPLGSVKRVAWSDPIPLAGVKARGRALGATVNDVLCAAVAAGLRSWLVDRDVEPPAELRAFVPVDLRGGVPPDASLGNRFGLVYLPLPIGESDRVERILEVRRRMAAIKHTPEAGVAFAVLGLLGRLPAAVDQPIVDFIGARGSLVLTNVRGPTAPIRIAGEPVDEILFWVPQSGHLALGVSLLTYAGALRIGVSSDAGRLPDPGVLVAAIERDLTG